MHVYLGRQIHSRYLSAVLHTLNPTTPTPNLTLHCVEQNCLRTYIPYSKIRILVPSTFYKIVSQLLLSTLYIYSLTTAKSSVLATKLLSIPPTYHIRISS